MTSSLSLERSDAPPRARGPMRPTPPALAAVPDPDLDPPPATTTPDPLMIRAMKGQQTERAPAWMMRQAGRYQQSYRDLARRYPSFRERSETTDLIVEITMQPYESFQPDGLILFSDILTPLPALGVPFEIDDLRGPVLDRTIRDPSGLSMLQPLDLSQVAFVGDALTELRKRAEAAPTRPAVLGFVGCPWTMATYVVEGGASPAYKTIKGMTRSDPDTLKQLLAHLADALADYACFQIDSGAEAIQLFDSWGGQLPPHVWDEWSGPYIRRVVDGVKARHPDVPLTLYVNNSGGVLERMGGTGVDSVGLDWTLDMTDARRRLGDKTAVQGNVDPVVLFGDHGGVREAVETCLVKARGAPGHVLNLGHGVMVGTPEEAVAAFFDHNRAMTRERLQELYPEK